MSELSHVAACLTQADARARHGQWHDAAATYSRALEADRGCVAALKGRAACLLRTGQYAQAVEDADRLLEGNPSSAAALLLKSEALFSLGRFEHSLIHFYRGYRLRNSDAFRIGIQKAKAAIEASFASVQSARTTGARPPSAPPSGSRTARVAAAAAAAAAASTTAAPAEERAPPATAEGQAATSKQVLLGELHKDKMFLEDLLADPAMAGPGGENAFGADIRTALQYLEQRAEFWRQRRPFRDQSSHHRQQERPQSARQARRRPETAATPAGFGSSARREVVDGVPVEGRWQRLRRPSTARAGKDRHLEQAAARRALERVAAADRVLARGAGAARKELLAARRSLERALVQYRARPMARRWEVLAALTNRLGRVQTARGQHRSALARHTEEARLCESHGLPAPQLADALHCAASALGALGRGDEAKALWERIQSLRLGGESPGGESALRPVGGES